MTGRTHSGRILYLDGWRGLALLLVLAGHFAPDGGFGLAVLGVELFFVLSGRLMADILFLERFPLPEFFRRRFSRVFPGMAAFVLLAWLATRESTMAFKPLAIGSALTFTLNYAMVFSHGVAAIENLWSLCIEEHAYAFLGLLAFLARRKAVSPVVAIAVVALASLLDAAVSTALLGQDYRQVYWRTDAHVASILLGALAYLLLRDRRLGAWVPPVAFLAGVVLWAAGDLVRYSLATACFAVAMATLDRARPALLRALSCRPMVYAGLCSYSVYLWQQPFARLALDRTIPGFAAAALAVFMGLASFYFVEQPARRYLNSHWRSFRAPRLHAKAQSPAL